MALAMFMGMKAGEGIHNNHYCGYWTDYGICKDQQISVGGVKGRLSVD
jgi:hypothetical protein